MRSPRGRWGGSLLALPSGRRPRAPPPPHGEGEPNPAQPELEGEADGDDDDARHRPIAILIIWTNPTHWNRIMAIMLNRVVTDINDLALTQIESGTIEL